MSASKKRLIEEEDDMFKSRLSNPLKVNVRPVIEKKGDNKKFTIYCSRDLLQMRSEFFNCLIDNLDVGENVLELIEHDPEQTIALLRKLHDDMTALPVGPTKSLEWNPAWVALSIKWILHGYIEEYSKLCDEKINLIKNDLCTSCRRYTKQLKCARGHTHPSGVTHSPCNSLIVSFGVTHSPCNSPIVSFSCPSKESIIKEFWDAVELVLTHEPLRVSSSLKTVDDLCIILVNNFSIWTTDEIMLRYLTPEMLLKLTRDILSFTSSRNFKTCQHQHHF